MFSSILWAKGQRISLRSSQGDLGLSKKQTGDVKYHQGFSSDIQTSKKHDVHLALMFNPSHLELVNPVIEGYARYHQDKNDESERQQDSSSLSFMVMPPSLDREWSWRHSTCLSLEAIEPKVQFTSLSTIKLALQPQSRMMQGLQTTARMLLR